MLDVDLADVDFGSEGEKALHERQQWLQWTILSYEELAKLYQPPYGERAVTLQANRSTNRYVRVCAMLDCFRAIAFILNHCS